MEELKAALDEQVGLVAEMKDKYFRALADGENARVRGRKMTDDAKIYAIQSFVKVSL